jgi:hypothetical protein
MKLVAAVMLVCAISYPATVALSTANEWVEVYNEALGDIVAHHFIATNAISPEDSRGHTLVASKATYSIPLYFPEVGKEVSSVYTVNRLNCAKGTARIVADSGVDESGTVVFTNQISRTFRETIPARQSGLGKIVDIVCSNRPIQV